MIKPFVIIPVYNRKEFTRSCLISLKQQTYSNISIVVIDDGSTDGTNQMLNDSYPDVHVIRGDGNYWWTKSVNKGIQYALTMDATVIITINDDTVLFKDFIEKMLYWHQENPLALLGALALNSKTSEFLYGGEIVNWWTAGSKKLINTLKKSEMTGLHQVTHFPGRGLLIPRQVFEEIGYFDEKNFPQRSADLDFTFRASRAGFRIYCNYDAKIFMYPQECGDYEYRQGKSLIKYYKHLFTLKGGGNIIEFVKFAIKNAPVPYLPFYLLSGLARRIGGYLRDWIKDIFREKK